MNRFADKNKICVFIRTAIANRHFMVAWISWESIGIPVTAHLPYCAAYKEIRLSAYSMVLPFTGFLISHNIVAVSIARFLWICSRPLTVYLLMDFLLCWAFFDWTYPSGTAGRPWRNLICLLAPYFSLMNPFLSCPFLDKSPFSLFLSCLLILKASLLKSWDTSVEIQ